MNETFHEPLRSAHPGQAGSRAISLAIPCFNAQRFLPLTLAGVACMKDAPSEVLVLDDGSTDGTLELARTFAPFLPGLRCLRNVQNRGLGATRNWALKEANCDLLAWLDADCCPDVLWLQRLRDTYSEVCARGEKVAVVMGSLVERQVRGSGAGWRSRHLGQQATKAGQMAFFFGSNFLCDKTLALSCGGFAEDLRTNYEDIELSARLGRRGFGIYHEPAALAFHAKQLAILPALSSFSQWHRAGFCQRSDGQGLRKIGFALHLAKRAVATDFAARHWSDLPWSLALPVLLGLQHAVQSSHRL